MSNNHIKHFGILLLFLLSILLPGKLLTAQSHLQPGFDPLEQVDGLKMDFKMMFDTLPMGTIYHLKKGSYEKVYRSPEVGLSNRFEIYVRDGNVAVVTLRGTIGKAESWIENFYMAMVNANGHIKINDSTEFKYKLASDSMAMVHAGWLLGLASMAPYLNKQLENLIDKGVTDFIVNGHSQGGALAFLTTSYIWYKYHEKYPALRLKTYASAAPKPGNLYYAYDFDYITRGGYGFRVVNTVDWVPETPMTIQTISDYNAVNPLSNAKGIIKQQKFLARLVFSHIYHQLDRSSYKAVKKYRKWLGSVMYKQVKKSLPQYEQPSYPYAINYTPAGVPIILKADSAYLDRFKFDGKDFFVHHQMKPYLYLLEKEFDIDSDEE